MSYLRKYGPKGKRDIASEEVRTIVEKFIERTPISAAVVAPFGVGKTTFARMVAKGIFCKSQPGSRPCGQCLACVSVDEQWQSSTSVNGRVVGGGEFEVIDCTSLGIEHMGSMRDRITLYKSRPEIFIFDEFHRAKPLVQESFLKIVEADTTSSLLFCFATANTDNITKALLQRLSLFVLSKPETRELLPLVQRIAAEERLRIVDAQAPERLVNACGRVPRIVLKAMEMLAFDGDEMSLRSVQKVINRLKLIDGGKEQA